jgi:hypothetical protein
MPKLSSYTLLAVGDIAPAADSVLLLDASAPVATATRRALVSSIFGAALQGTVPTTGNLTLSGGNARTLAFTGFTNITVASSTASVTIDGGVSTTGQLNLFTPLVDAGGIAVGQPLVLYGTSGWTDFGMTSELWVLNAPETVSASRALTNADHGKLLRYSGGSSITLTIPSGLMQGFRVTVLQEGSGKVTALGSGVTVQGRNNHLSTGGAWHCVRYHRLTASLYVVEGDVGA